MQAAAGSTAAPRPKVDKLSSEVVDSNPYSRLMALQRMGIVKDYEQIRNKTVGGCCGWPGCAAASLCDQTRPPVPSRECFAAWAAWKARAQGA